MSDATKQSQTTTVPFLPTTQERVPVSVVVIARNEAANIVRCLHALHWCAEIVVVDDNSSDDTAELARMCGARLLTHRFESFATQRNWALADGELQYDWVLMLDADEVATPEFAAAVRQAIVSAARGTVAFRTCRKTMLLDSWLRFSDGFPVWIMRLVRRDVVQFQDSGHGEVPVPEVEGNVESITEPFLHYPFSKGLDEWMQRHLRYAEREARLELDTNARGPWYDVLHWRRDRRRRALRWWSRQLPARPSLRFAYQYFLKGGFLDGTAGLLFCRLMAQYESMILAKRCELQAKERNESL